MPRPKLYSSFTSSALSSKPILVPFTDWLWISVRVQEFPATSKAKHSRAGPTSAQFITDTKKREQTIIETRIQMDKG